MCDKQTPPIKCSTPDVPVCKDNSTDSSDQKDQDMKIRFICENINELRRNFRKEILQIMLGSQIPDSKIYEKGGGTQIKISDIPRELINTLYNYIKKKLECTEEII